MLLSNLSLADSKIKREYSNPRRYSFFLGSDSKIHTPSEFLIKKGRVTNFEDLQSRFSVEVVNKEFYQRIAVQFSRLIGGQRKIGSRTEDFRRTLSLPSVSDHNVFQEFAVRLIGRLVFCWFLKMKKSDNGIPLISDDVLSIQSVKSKNNYYHDVLEKLFFEVLNTPISERQKEFKENPYIDIPFLNGGLFNPHRYDFYDVDRSGISKFLNTLRVPDKWLEDFIEILETYNFTVDENTSVDVDLSVDPEMLGRIFENLLAEIIPETGESARKASGSYYTPRPIVEYMVDESLKHYLLTETRIDENLIMDLLSYSGDGIELDIKDKEEIIDAFDKVKILDPACGSGAFPMGILQKMLLVLKRVDPNSQMWLKKQLARVKLPALRSELKRKLADENVDYIHKLGIIQNSIYGVDIQPIATEISKLRCFLSLIVDEHISDDKENRGILPLPNLEFKFVAANSIFSLNNQYNLFDLQDEINQLKLIREEYFTPSIVDKNEIVKKFYKFQQSLAKKIIDRSQINSLTSKLSNWDPFSYEKVNWFDPELMFGEENQFNIIIGNPPYLGQKGNKKIFEEIKEHNEWLNFYERKQDIYYYFIAKGINLLKSSGVLVFIVPPYFLTAFAAKSLRNTIRTKVAFESLIWMGDSIQVFQEANINSIIIKLVCSKELMNQKIKIFELNDFNRYNINLRKLLKFYPSKLSTNNLTQNEWYLLKDADTIELTSHRSIPLGKLATISPGIQTGCDKVCTSHLIKHKITEDINVGDGIFVLNDFELKNAQFSKHEMKYVKKLYKNSDIDKWFFREAHDRWIIITNEIDDINEVPHIKKHLIKYKKILDSRYRNYALISADKEGKWWYLYGYRPNTNFEEEKIVHPYRATFNKFAYSDAPFYSLMDVFFINI